MKKFTIAITILFTTLFAFSQEYDQSVDSLMNETDMESLIYYLRNLSGEDSVVVNGTPTIIEHRVSNWGNDLAAEYIKETLDGFGFEAQVQEYSSSGTNVYAIQEGTLYPEQYYIICAHYDAVDYYCADDNASGSAAVLEAARLLSQSEFEYSIIYALWDEEEIGLIGSGYYAGQAAGNSEQIMDVINMDMISWDNDEDMVVEIHSSYSGSSNVLSTYIEDFIINYNLPLVPAIQLPGTSASDHSKFWNQNYSAVLLIEEYYGGDFNPYYHTENDRIAILNLPYFYEMAKMAIGVIVSKAMPVEEVGVGIYMVNGSGIEEVKNFPNPFNGSTTINYTLKENSYTQVNVVNSFGKEVALLSDGIQSSGEHSIVFSSEGLPAGLYFLQIQSAGGSAIHKMMIQ